MFKWVCKELYKRKVLCIYSKCSILKVIGGKGWVGVWLRWFYIYFEIVCLEIFYLFFIIFVE